MKLPNATAVFEYILPYVMKIYQKTTIRGVPIRRLSLSFDSLSDEAAEGYDFFTDPDEVDKLKRLGRTTLEIQTKYGKNSLFTATDLQEGATQLERNKLIGGHASGE